MVENRLPWTPVYLPLSTYETGFCYTRIHHAYSLWLLTVHISPLAVHTSLLTVHTLLLAVHTSLLAVHTLLLPVHTSLLDVHTPLLIVHTPLLALHTPLLVVHTPHHYYLYIDIPLLPVNTSKPATYVYACTTIILAAYTYLLHSCTHNYYLYTRQGISGHLDTVIDAIIHKPNKVCSC